MSKKSRTSKTNTPFKVNLEQNNIFAFWESPNPIPAYLDLCRDTWIKNIPNCKIHILNHSNLHQYIGDIYDIEKLKTISFAMQSDIISAAVLEKFGGLFLDLDCIVTDNVFDILSSISEDKLISFGRPNTKAIHLAVLFCRKPNNPILREWRKAAQERLINKPEQYPWHYFGNGIINPLLNEAKYKNDFYIIDRTQSGNILESAVFGDDPNNAINDYKKLYFSSEFTFTPDILNKVNCGVISLHNSWSPQEYKNMPNKVEFLNSKAPISSLLDYVLNHNTQTKGKMSLPLLEAFIKNELNNHSINCSTKYFRNMLVLDFMFSGINFAFDISLANNLANLDLIIRNAPIDSIVQIDYFSTKSFNVNKARILSNESNKERVITEILAINSAIQNAKSHWVNTIEKDIYVDLKEFKLVGSQLYIEGLGIITGQNAKEYRDIDYKLIIKGKTTEYVKALGKVHRPELTAQYAKGSNFIYDKCWFATPNFQGIDISDIPTGNYEFLLKISINGFVKIVPLQTESPLNFDNEFFIFKIDEIENKFSIKQKLENDITFVRFDNNKIKPAGRYQDEFNNVIEAPFNLNNVNVQFFGKNNRLILNEKSNLKNTFIEFKGDNSQFQIGEKAGIWGTFRLGYDCQINIGNGVTSTNSVYVTCAEKTKISIGNDCMFATNNQIRTDDSHAIYDVNTGKRVNLSKDIVIGDHVWIAYGATILGGSNIGNGSVIGSYSLVKKAIPNNCVAAGIPAKVIKKDIFWERPLLLNEADEKVFPSEYLEQMDYINRTEE